MKKVSSSKLLRPRQNWFCILECEINNGHFCPNGLPIAPFFVDLLSQESSFGHTHTQKYPMINLKIQASKNA